MTNKELNKQVGVSIRYIVQFSKGLDKVFKPEKAVEFDRQLNTLIGEISIFSNIIKSYILEDNWKLELEYTILEGRLTLISMLNEYPLLDKQVNKNLIQLELYSLFSFIELIKTQDGINERFESIKAISYHLLSIKRYLRFEGNHEKA